MSLRIRRIAIDGFRKFREQFEIEGLTDGLNIVIEPNETGKSTLLEALRAAFFVRHNTKNQLAQSFAPYGDAVGPQIRVAFEVHGAPWSVTKRFLRNPTVEVTGPGGRAQGEEAEARLNSLLGSIRDSSRSGDASTYGALGLLWVSQTEALSITPPNQLVRETVRSTLEAEVGSISEGPAYKKVRTRVDRQYENYWTVTGQKRGRQNDARERVDRADAAAQEAADRLAVLEKNFSELETAQARLKLIRREIADDTDVQTRKDLFVSLEVARAAVQILATRRAELEAINRKLEGITDLQRRHQEATAARDKANAAVLEARERRAIVTNTISDAKVKVADVRTTLELARTGRKNGRAALAAGEEQLRQTRRQAAITSARARHIELLELERRHLGAKTVANTAIPPGTIAALEAADRAVAEARAIVKAGETRIALFGQTTGITIDGEPMQIGERALTRETRIRFGEAELIVRPPPAAASAEEALASLLRKQVTALEEIGVENVAAARARSEAAREAAADLRTLEARIEAITPADEAVGLGNGSDALKLFVSRLTDDDALDKCHPPDLSALASSVEEADALLARAEGAYDGAIEALGRAEAEDVPLAMAEAGAASDLTHALASIKTIEGRPEWANLTEDIVKGRQAAATASVRLEEAIRDASAHDAGAISRKIENIEARARVT